MQEYCSGENKSTIDTDIDIRGVQRHPGDAKCVTEILGGTKIRKLWGQNLKCVDVYV